ncbi:MAG: ABC transporter permease [Coriobacteriia bacterium]
MSLSRMFKVLAKDVRTSPRTGVLIMAFAVPVVLTLVVQVVFGSLFDPDPRLGIVDHGDSELTQRVQELDGVQVSLYDDEEVMRELIESNDLDGGIVLPAGFDEDLKAGERPEMRFWLGGESLAANRLVISVTTIDLIREVEGAEPPVEVVKNVIGEEDAIPLSDRLTSILVFYALVMGGLYVPAMGLVEEREKGTLSALLVSPVRLSEVVVAKGVFGIGLGAILTLLTLALNGALTQMSAGLALSIALGALMSVLIGLAFAELSKDAVQLYTFVKGTGILLFAPVLWHLFPDWPQWIAKIFPTYWMINPLYETAVLSKGLGDVAGELAVGLAICVVLAVIVGLLAKRMQFRIAAE